MKEQMPEVSVVMPCLNEEEVIGYCVEQAKGALDHLGIAGEIIVADNGSEDRSVEIASSLGARVVHQPLRGYGHAYHRGIEEAKGRYIVIGDSDGTYDFGEMGKFIEGLKNGQDLVMGSRLKGKIFPGAMPVMHRYFGVPILTWLLNLISGSRVSDAHCGMRAFKRDSYHQLTLRSGGMEFASEMIIAFAKAGYEIGEVPIDYHAREGESKLRTFRDGWRHARFLLLYSPLLLFLVPGVLMFLLGMGIMCALLSGPITLRGVVLDVHSMILGSLLAIVGSQVVTLGVYGKIFSLRQGLVVRDRTASALLRHVTLEKGLVIGILMAAGGMAWLAWVLVYWAAGDYLSFEAGEFLRPSLFGMTLVAIGVQVVFSSFFLSLMATPKR